MVETRNFVQWRFFFTVFRDSYINTSYLAKRRTISYAEEVVQKKTFRSRSVSTWRFSFEPHGQSWYHIWDCRIMYNKKFRYLEYSLVQAHWWQSIHRLDPHWPSCTPMNITCLSRQFSSDHLKLTWEVCSSRKGLAYHWRPIKVLKGELTSGVSVLQPISQSPDLSNTL